MKFIITFFLLTVITLTGSSQSKECFSFKISEKYDLEGIQNDFDTVYLKEITNNLGSKLYFCNGKIAFTIGLTSGEMNSYSVRIVPDTIQNVFIVFDENLKEFNKIYYDDDRLKKISSELIGDSKEIYRATIKETFHGYSLDSVEITYQSVDFQQEDTIKGVESPKLSEFYNKILPISGKSNPFFIRSVFHENGINIVTFPEDFNDTDLIPDSIFSTSTNGYSESSLNTTYPEEFDRDKKLKEYDLPYEGTANNIDKVKSIYNAGLLKTFYYDSTYIATLENDKVRFDNYAILKMLKNEVAVDKIKSVDEALSIIKKHQIMSSADIDFLKKIENENKGLTLKEFWDYAMLKQLKTDFSNRDVRYTIVQNCIKLRVASTEDAISHQMFIDGEIDFADYITRTSNYIKPLKINDTIDIVELKPVVMDLLNKAFGNEISYQVENSENNLKIITSDESYTLPLNNLIPYSYDEDGNAKELNTKPRFVLNKYFYETLLKTLKQIDVDYALPYAFSIYDFDKIILEPYDYNAIVDKYPELKLFKIKFAFNKFLFEEYDAFADYPISFLHNCNAKDEQFTIATFKMGDMDGKVPYVTNSKKRIFIHLITKNKEKYKLTKNSIETIEKEITNQLIESEGLLFSKLPNLCIKYGAIEDTYIKSNAPNKTKNTFKEAFPVLDNLMEGTFDAINFTYFEKPLFHFEFEYKNKKYETGVSARELLTTISDLIKTPNDNSKTFYFLPSTIWEKLYLYISPLQAEEISSLFDVNLERLDIK